jgi:hypothetical protein
LGSLRTTLLGKNRQKLLEISPFLTQSQEGDALVLQKAISLQIKEEEPKQTISSQIHTPNHNFEEIREKIDFIMEGRT